MKATTVGSFGAFTETLSLVSALAADPALHEIRCQLDLLSKLAKGEKAAACPYVLVTKEMRSQGVGLWAAQKPLRAYVWTQANPVKTFLLASGVVGSIFALGFWAGRR